MGERKFHARKLSDIQKKRRTSPIEGLPTIASSAATFGNPSGYGIAVNMGLRESVVQRNQKNKI